MDKKLTTIIGLKKTDFDNYVKTAKVSVRCASLIPIYKLGDEAALTSVILSSLRLIKEFRKHVLSTVKMINSGRIYVYTEVCFEQYPDSRLDGLLLIVKKGIIKDAALFEMKNGNSELAQEQIDRYVAVAKNYNISRLITISNQFVTEPSQSPLHIRNTTSFQSFHFSWSYLLTIAHILLFDNDTNIADQDQVEIMREVVRYLENEKSGVCGFNQMKSGWKSVVEKIISGTKLRTTDEDVEEAVVSWQQEEKDIALILSRKLGVYVTSGESRYKGKLNSRIDDDKKTLLAKNHLSSSLRVKGAVADISMNALFEKRIIALSVLLEAPKDKKLRGQISWVKRQLENCRKRDEDGFRKIADEIRIDLLFKKTSKFDRIKIEELENIHDEIAKKELKGFRILYIKDFGKNFASRNKFVQMLEDMVVEYYKKVVQFLAKWEQPTPKIVEKQNAKFDIPPKELMHPLETKKEIFKEKNTPTNTNSQYCLPQKIEPCSEYGAVQ